jgi:hypothetical protein
VFGTDKHNVEDRQDLGIDFQWEGERMKGYRYRFNGHGFNLIKVIYRIIGTSFEPVFFEDRVEFVDVEGAIFLTLFNDPGQIRMVFRVSVPKLEGVTEGPLETAEGKVNSWTYLGDKVEDVVFLSEIGLANYISHHQS